MKLIHDSHQLIMIPLDFFRTGGWTGWSEVIQTIALLILARETREVTKFSRTSGLQLPFTLSILAPDNTHLAPDMKTQLGVGLLPKSGIWLQMVPSIQPPSSTYSADPQRSSFSAAPGPVEIHAFSRWNWRQTFCRCTFTHSNVWDILIHANRQERFFPTSAHHRIAPEDQIFIIISPLFADNPHTFVIRIHTSKWHKKILTIT
jgi:hypothetical protein